MDLLITGVAGFIGFHTAKYRLEQGDRVVGIDNLNDYYDVNLKKARLQQLQAYERFIFYPADITHASDINVIFKRHRPRRVIHLAAQAGVRYSLSHPEAYVQANLVGFAGMIETCRHHDIEHLVYASTSSVYGANKKQPNQETDATDQPLTIYAATKKANELMAHSYSHLYQLPTTGLRFFTVYGPWGRPDMAFFSFTRSILAGTPIQIYNYGRMQRDFTYIDDIVMSLSLVVDKPALANSDGAPYNIYNIGCGKPVHLLDYIQAIEQATGKLAIKEWLPLQPGDVLSTHADTTCLQQDIGYVPQINFKEGIARFVNWYQHVYTSKFF